MQDDHGIKVRMGIARARARGVEWGKNGTPLAATNRQQASELAEKLRLLIVKPNPTLPDACS